MPRKIDFFGKYFDPDVAPAFINAGPDFVYHYASRRLIRRQSVEDSMTAGEYTAKDGEIGDASEDFQKTHLGIPYAPSDPDNNGGGGDDGMKETGIDAVADQAEMTITIHGGPAEAAGKVVVNYRTDGSTEAVVVEAAFDAGATRAAIGQSVAQGFTGEDMTASSNSGVVTLAFGTATSLDQLTAGVKGTEPADEPAAA